MYSRTWSRSAAATLTETAHDRRRTDTDDGGPADSVGVFYRWSPQLPMSSGVFDDEQFVAIHWNGSRTVMEQTLPEPACDWGRSGEPGHRSCRHLGIAGRRSIRGDDWWTRTALPPD